MDEEVKLEFESVKCNIGTYIHRAKVPGGWLVACMNDVQTFQPSMQRNDDGYEWRPALTFVPDPTHSWK